MCEDCVLSHTLIPSFSCPTPLLSSILSFLPHISFFMSTGNPTTEQWWRQSGWPITQRHLQSTTFKNDFTGEQKDKARWNPSKSPDSEILESLLLLPFPSLTFYLQLIFYETRRKKKKKKTAERQDRLILMRWLKAPDESNRKGLFSLWWEDRWCMLL